MTTIESDDPRLLLACPQCGQRNRLIYERLGQIFRCGRCHAELRPPSEPIEVKSEALFDAIVGHSRILAAFPLKARENSNWLKFSSFHKPLILKMFRIK